MANEELAGIGNDDLDGMLAEAETELFEEETVEEPETPEEPEETTAEQAEAEREDAPSPKEKSAIPLAVLREERDRRQQAELEAQRWRQKAEEFERKQAALDEAAKAAEEIPDFNYDPTGHLAARLERFDAKMSQIDQAEMQRRAQEQIMGALQHHETSFVREHPDYYDALEHVRHIERMKMEPLARAMGLTEAQVEQTIRSNEFQGSAGLLQRGINPAEFVYQTAKAYGYTGKQQSDTSADDKRIENLKQGQQRAGKLGSGATPKTPVEDNDDASVVTEFDMAMKELYGSR